MSPHSPVMYLYQINTTTSKTVQSELHSAARLIMQKRKFERITPTLRDDLHWLPVPERIVFKLCSIIFKCRHQTAPQYLQELSVPVAATCSTSLRHVRSAARGNLLVLACRTFSFEFWTTQLCCLRPKTLELSTIATSGSNTYNNIIL